MDKSLRAHGIILSPIGTIESAVLDARFNAKLTATPAVAVTDVTGTADATYSANETTLINDTKTQLNALLAALRTAGIITT